MDMQRRPAPWENQDTQRATPSSWPLHELAVPEGINDGGEKDERCRFGGVSGPGPLRDRGAKAGTGQVTDDSASSRSPQDLVGVPGL